MLLGIVPAALAVAAIALALAAHRLASALAGRSMRARVVAAAEAVAAGVDEALDVLRARDPAIIVGAAAYLLFDVATLGVCFTAFGNEVRGRRAAGRLPRRQARQPDPDPGGIGGVDGGLIGTLVLYGVDPPTRRWR